jgi:hypothetical protein
MVRGGHDQGKKFPHDSFHGTEAKRSTKR